MVGIMFEAVDVAAALRPVLRAMSREAERHPLRGADLPEGGEWATSGHLLMLSTIARDASPVPAAIIPRETVTRLIGLLRGVRGPISVAIETGRIVVSAMDWDFGSKLIDGTSPTYARVIPERLPQPLL